MDLSFQNSLLVNKSPFSPRSRQSLNNTKRVLQQSFRKSSRFSVSGKSTQSAQILIKSQYNSVERFGQPLPVLITEALTFADRSTIVTARISACGYAWVVCGRRLLIWQYRQSPAISATPQRKHGLANQCFELQLPQSDLAHRAELVSVFMGEASNIPSCIAVSPEGVIRYWPAVAHENVTVEQSVDLQGQECDSLTDVEGLGCVLATTTCTIVLIQPQLNGGRHAFSCKTLKTPSGWLGGFGKRMSSLIFGPNSNEQMSETRLVRILSYPNRDFTWTIFVLAGHSIQKWIVSQNGNEQLVYVAEFSRLVRDYFRSHIWEHYAGDQAEIDTWLLDIQLDKDNIVLLSAAVNMAESPQVHYAMIWIEAGTNQPPTHIKEFLRLKISALYREDNPADSLYYRMLICGNYSYLYNQKSITVVRAQEEPDTLEFSSHQDFILGGSICVNTPIFFCRNNGLVAVSNNELTTDFMNLSIPAPSTPLEMSFSEGFTANNLSVYNMDPVETSRFHQDSIGQLKAAFIFYLKSQQQACQEIIEEAFPAESALGVDTVLDEAVMLMSKDMLDDVPAGDPRWDKNTPAGIGSSYSMQVLHQLEDKQKVYSLFMGFLRTSGLYYRLAACTARDVIIPTVYMLAEAAEKITAAVILKSLPNSMLLENALEKAIQVYETEPGNGLTNQDIFYREISKVHIGIQELVNCCEDVAHSDLIPSEICQHVSETNEIVLTVLNEVIQYRQQNAESFLANDLAKSLTNDYLTWVVASGSEGVGDALVLQHSLTFNYGIKLTSPGQLRNSLLDQFVALTDLILDGRKSHLETVKNNPRERILYKQYCTDRHKLIKPLLQEKEWEKAGQLAEKYLDFEILVLICEFSNNQNRLDEYIERFHGEGFAEYVYNWFLKENKQGKLIEKYRKGGKSRQRHNLSTFLSGHNSLSWMQNIFDKKYSMAADTLRQLGEEETDSVTKQKTIYSLCKLAKIAGPNSENADSYVKNVDAQLELISFQEELPDYVLQCFGYDTVKPIVIPPKELINLYICKEYTDATELEFKKALDVLQFVDDDEMREELCLKIWRQAILRDSWNHTNLDAPLDILQDMLFFKLVDFAVALGANPEALMPPLDTLIDDASMAELQENKNFQYLLKTAYDHIFRRQMAE